ncbi:hypothetical protein CLOLEP_01825 [[Clostridium] leptum DSM 753]|uniref:Uncharacterized protein n=1 Tax=[Clostridium] leptum DSM 753 TaxID=428125 RepID=A7VTD3_9FIRM|nr:hypothetical protein CLOLEP_01825 [[Clostridium] leptum DSM 753]
MRPGTDKRKAALATGITKSGKIKYPNHILNQNRRFVKWTM